MTTSHRKTSIFGRSSRNARRGRRARSPFRPWCEPTPAATVLKRSFLIVKDEITVARALAGQLVGLGYDVSAVAAHELEDRFFENAIDLLCFLSFDGYFHRLNPAWERTLGYSREELMSRPFIEFVHPDDRERTLKQNALVRGGGQAVAFENRYVCKDGSYRWLLWNACADRLDATIYSVARDITARKHVEEDRERLVLELQAALQEVRALREIIPICSYCRKLRDDENYWHTVEAYFHQETATRFSHGICPTCLTHEVDALEQCATLKESSRHEVAQ